MQKVFFLSAWLMVATFLQSQDPCASLNYHAFKAENLSGTYTDLGSLGLEIEVSNLDDGISDPQEIGFEFVYQCQPFTQFIFNTNGFIKLGTETNPTTNLFFSNAQSVEGGIFSNTDSNNVNLIAAFNHDIEVVTGDPEFRVYTSGIVPNRVCTIQWKNMQEWSSDPATKQYIDMDFQIKLYETSNVIEFVYGDWGPSLNPSNYKTAGCGLKGMSNEDDQLLVVVKNSSAHWDNVTFHNGEYAPTESFNFGNPPDRPKPDPGRTYRFTPTHENDLSVRQVYTLGYASVYYSSPQSISANIQNSGFNTQLDVPVILDITGVNTFRDTQYISSLAFGENVNVTFSGFTTEMQGGTFVNVLVDDDDFDTDNSITRHQLTNNLTMTYSSDDGPDGGYGFSSGVQGIYFVKFPVHGTAAVHSVSAYLVPSGPSQDVTIYMVVLNADGEQVGRSDDYVIQTSDLGTWYSFAMQDLTVISDSYFYAGIALPSSFTEYSILGVQDEDPIRPETYFTSLITTAGLAEMDPQDFSFRFMIGATLAPTEPQAGLAIGDTSFCAFGMAHLHLEGFTGFITWQQSQDGFSGWENVSDGSGATTDFFTTGALTSSTYFRASVFQPEFPEVYSNIIFVEVVPPLPVITISGDVLSSSATSGNQWHNENGIIPGATGQYYFVLTPGLYHVVVTEGDCNSAPSNTIEILTVGTNEFEQATRIKIYPNPVGDKLTIELEGNAENVNFEIFNVLGQVVYTGLMVEKLVISTREFSSGSYFIRFDGQRFWSFVKD